MEVDQIHCSNKFPRTNNDGFQNFASTKLGKMDEQDDEGDNNRSIVAADAASGGGDGRLYGWPSSRIVRVSRASGGKDRHSKVLTSKGLRDRRVRLSVNTAIQFYDLQDRLGYDQPSKAVEWLLAAAAGAIDELPPMNTNFLNNERISGGIGRYQFDSAAAGGGGHYLEAAARVSISSPPGSSNSGSSKGSGISSISRSESRMKARERAKERVEKEKEKENDSSAYVTSFTELLSGRNNGNNGGGSDYFTSGLFGPPTAPVFSVTAEHHHHSSELQPFSFAPPAFNRGTLQSNSSSTPTPSIFPPPPSFYSGVDNHHHHHFTGFWQKEKEKN